MEVKRRSHSHKNLPRKIPAMRRHPLFLFRCTDTNEDQVGSAIAYHLLDMVVFRCCQRTEGWRICSRDHQFGISRVQFVAKGSKDLGTAAVEEYAIPVTHGCFTEPQHQRRPVDSLLSDGAKRAQCPDHGHPVRGCNIGAVEGASQLRITPGSHDSVDRCQADVLCSLLN